MSKKPTPNSRSLWRPKLPEVPQCVSCPFRAGNDKEFGEIVAKLQRLPLAAIPPFLIWHARMRIKEDLKFSGDFICHGTAYHKDMTRRPMKEARQCPGATEFFRASGKPIPKAKT